VGQGRRVSRKEEGGGSKDAVRKREKMNGGEGSGTRGLADGGRRSGGRGGE